MSRPLGKFTITGTHFTQDKPVRTGKISAPTHAIPQGRAYIRRMSWNINPGQRLEIKIKSLANGIRKTACQDADYYLDTCFLITECDPSILEAMLSRRVNLTPIIYQELSNWLANGDSKSSQRQRIIQLLAAGDQRLRLVQKDHKVLRHGYEYYCPLLVLRKLRGYHFEQEFKGKNNRLPSKGEFFRGFKGIDPSYDDRAFRIAWKGYQDYGKSNYAADEQLVTMAVLHALITGHETSIFTRDHDIMEQFYKLIQLMDTHYRSMLLAERYHASPDLYQPRIKATICEGYPNFFDNRFCGAEDVFLRPNLPPETMWNDLLPESSGTVNIDCTWFGNMEGDKIQVAQLTFNADRDILKLLEIKHDTKGLNTDLLNGKNCHIWPAPELGEALGACVAIVEDRLVSYHPTLPPFRVLDMMHALRCKELFDRYEIVDAPPHFPLAAPID
jgi:hypothetical protein